jgi:FkbM family methyltransferase
MVRPSVPDPVEVSARLWQGFHGTTGWDVGANCGQSILEMAFEFTSIVSFEPSPDSFAEALRTVEQHHMHAEVLNIALSDHDGYVTLAYPGNEQRETGQLVTPGTKGMEWEPEDWATVDRLSVPCKRADTVAAERGTPDFIKVDTEGHELKVLQGASWVLSECRTDWLVEFHTPANMARCQGLLIASGHETEVVRHPHYRRDLSMWQQHGWIRAFARHPTGQRR